MIKNHPAPYFIICSLIWGLTWIAIKLQINSVDGNIAVFYRFFFAFLIMFFFAIIKKTNLRYNKKDHFRFAWQGLFMFCINFLLTYWASSMANSSLIALAFTALIFFNMFGAKFFLKIPFHKKVLYGAVFAFSGMTLICYHEYQEILISPMSIWGFLISLLATLFASIGNLVSTKNRLLKIPIIANNAFSMMYGCAFTFIYCVLKQKNFHVELSSTFIWSFLYLCLFGTVISFASYQKLLEMIGPSKAAFTSVISPLIALAVSSYYEQLQWTIFLITGVILTTIGNLIALTDLQQFFKRLKFNMFYKFP